MGMETNLFFWIALIIGYFIGSIPSGYLFARMYGVQDIRDHGSGNIGATNVARVLGFKFFFIVFLADFLKSYLYLIALSFQGFAEFDLICVASALLLGNGYSLFFGSRSGKGVATTAGILCALAPFLLGVLLCGWILVFALSRTAGIASIVLLVCMPFCAYFLTNEHLFRFAFFASIWGLLLHRNNIRSYAQMFI